MTLQGILIPSRIVTPLPYSLLRALTFTWAQISTHFAVWKISHKQIKILRWWCRTTATNQVSYVLPCVVPPWTLVDSPPLYSPRLIFFSSSFHTGQDVWKQHNAVRLVACRRSLINSWWSKNQLQRRRVKWKHDTTNTTTLSNQIKLGCPASRHR